jgi:hypothetical protein
MWIKMLWWSEMGRWRPRFNMVANGVVSGANVGYVRVAIVR